MKKIYRYVTSHELPNCYLLRDDPQADNFQSTCPKVVATFTSSQPRKQSKRLEPFQVMPCCQ